MAYSVKPSALEIIAFVRRRTAIGRSVAKGAQSAHVIAFARGERVITVVPRLTLKLAGNWLDTSIEIPRGSWRNELTGETVDGGEVHTEALLKRFPVALLARVGDLMTSFSVWAPNANKVEVETANLRYPMTAGENGWWTTELSISESNADYRFVLDGGHPLPDPRSPWQPHGIDGPSRIIDHNAFSWTDQRWQAPPLSAAIVYELHIGTFTPEGTFVAAIDKLDHLIELGISHVELMPVAEFSGSRGWGYDGVDLYAPHHAYGGPEGLKRLVDACHGRGLAVILDVVYNHLGPAGNYLAHFGPYFTDRYATPWGQAINFDGPDSNHVRRFFCDNALMWLGDYHFDALRIDAVHAILDTSAVHFLEQLATEVTDLATRSGRHLALIAESDLNDPRVVYSQAIGGYGIHAQWSDDFHHALHAVLTGERDGYYADFASLADLAKALQRVFVYDGRYSSFRGAAMADPPSDCRDILFWVICRTTIKSAIAPRANAAVI